MTTTPGLGADAEPRKSAPVTLARDEPASTAFVAVALECIDHWRSNESMLLHTRAMPHLHQTRVGVRRLRSAFSLFRPLLQDVPGSRDVAHRLRTLALPFGRARDLDVLLAGPLVDGLDTWQVTRLWRARETAYDVVVSVLRSREWADAGRSLDDLVASAPWSLPDDPPILPLAGAALDRRLHRVVGRMDRLAEMPPAERHRVRIEAKKLRYGCEFFASLHPTQVPRVTTQTGEVLVGPLAYSWQVEQVQSALGALNDHHASDELLRSVRSGAPAVDEDALVDAGVAAVRALAVVPPFWR